MINKLVYMLFSQLVLIFLQLELGSWGWTLPLAMLGALYLVLAFGRSWGCAAALFNAVILASLYGSWSYLYIVINPLLAGMLGWWIDRHDEDVRPDFWLPGAVAGCCGAIPALTQQCLSWSSSGDYSPALAWLLLRMLWSMALSAWLFEAFIIFNEALAEYLGLPRFFTRKGGQAR